MTIIPDKMLAAGIDGPGGTLFTREVPVPSPGHGEVLVRMAAAPVNPSDLARLKRGGFEPETYIPGLEGSGTVVAAGKGILPSLMKGRRVACTSEYPESGTWAEYMVTKAGKCFPLDKNIDDEQGSMMMVNPLTAIGFLDIVRKNHHKALINNAAASALGRMTEIMASSYSIPVINIVRGEKNVDTLRKSGSRHVLDSTEETFLNDLENLASKLDATILFDSVCDDNLGKMAGIMSEKSTIVIYGNLTGEEFVKINPRSLIDRDIKITGFYLGNRAKENGMLKNIMNLRKAGRLMRSGMRIKIRERFPLEKIEEAVNSYRSDMSAGKVLLIPKHISQGG